MRQDCWQVGSDRGFLMTPAPVVSLKDALANSPIPASELAHTAALAADLPHLLATHHVRAALEELPAVDLWALHVQLDQVDFRLVERLMQIYAGFASAFVYATDELPEHRIPAGIAVPLVQLADMVERPPILSYASYVLGNWELIDPAGGITLDNLRVLQSFLGSDAEAGFIRLHVAVEAQAAAALRGVRQAAQAAASDGEEALAAGLLEIASSVCGLIANFDRLTADADYTPVHPHIFSFTDVIYEGAFGNQPQTFTGQTGAQSALIPALTLALGLRHLTTNPVPQFEAVRAYLPKPHREYVERLRAAPIRAAVLRRRDQRLLAEAYNECLRQVIEFRSLYYRYAIADVAELAVPGGAANADWVQQLADETERQFV